MSTIAPSSTKRAHESLAGRPARLATYISPKGMRREIVAEPGAGASTLMIDRAALSGADERLVGHLAADEPAENARILCDLYLRSPDRGRCAKLTDEHLLSEPLSTPSGPTGAGEHRGLRDPAGHTYCLAAASGARRFLELRWRRVMPSAPEGPGTPVSLRDVVAALESYEPARSMTVGALERHAHNRSLSIVTLRLELERLDDSRVVLNRGLREAVQAAVRSGELSLSEIAIRCGRVKRDARGALSGETSWLARRTGQIPEAGRERPTPWVHSEVLALIARQGLGIAPHEVELG